MYKSDSAKREASFCQIGLLFSAYSIPAWTIIYNSNFAVSQTLNVLMPYFQNK